MRPSLSQTQYAGLSCLAKKVPSADQCVVVLHGYGANEQDFAPLSEWMKLKQEVSWIFPRAPHPLSMAMGIESYAWFPIDVEALEQAMQTGQYRQFSIDKMPGFLEARQTLENFVEQLPFDPDKIHLGGFSQGAMLATELALCAKEGPRSLSILSGSFIKGLEWSEKMKNKKSLAVFQSHGRSDPILSFEQARQLNQELENAGAQTEFLAFDGAHECPPPVIEAWARFLNSQICRQ